MHNANVHKLNTISDREESFEEYWYRCSGHAWPSKSRAQLRFNSPPSLYFRNAGWVYVLGNMWLADGLVKIGRTTGSIERRMRQLHTTGVPGAFDCLCAAWFSDCADAEAFVHERLDDLRVEADREFFDVDPATVRAELDEYAKYCDIHPLNMVEQAFNRRAYAIRNERVRGVLVAQRPRREDLEVPF